MGGNTEYREPIDIVLGGRGAGSKDYPIPIKDYVIDGLPPAISYVLSALIGVCTIYLITLLVRRLVR